MLQQLRVSRLSSPLSLPALLGLALGTKIQVDTNTVHLTVEEDLVWELLQAILLSINPNVLLGDLADIIGGHSP